MNKIKSIRELELMRQKLRIQEQLEERSLAGTSSKLLDNLTDTLKDIAIAAGISFAVKMVTLFLRRKK